jgi:putative transposase
MEALGMTRKPYPTDLTDEQWTLLEPYLPRPKSGGPQGGRPAADLREVCNGLFYHVRVGGSWRSLPHDLPPWSTVYDYFRTWRNDGTLERLHAALREEVRLADGRPPTPSAGIVDSQSVKMADQAGDRGYDAGKKNHRSQTPSAGRHARPGLGGGGHGGQRARSGRRADLVATGRRHVAPDARDLGR